VTPFLLIVTWHHFMVVKSCRKFNCTVPSGTFAGGSYQKYNFSQIFPLPLSTESFGEPYVLLYDVSSCPLDP
jgi:hypothetical protein